MSVFYVGQEWEAESTITHPKTKAKVDPTTVTCEVTKPDQTKSSASVTKVETGVYEAIIGLTEAGKWHAVFKGTGGYLAAQPTSITVYPV